MKAIIPAAGYGTRVGMSKDKSKEMLIAPYENGKHIIDYCLKLCRIFKLDPIVITREDKKDLRQYLFNMQIQTVIIEPKGEWPETVLASKEYWGEDNILILPDTRFKSIGCIDNIKRGLKLGNNAVFAMHPVIDPKNWGIIDDYVIYEKPDLTEGIYEAWGLIGFKNTYGGELFSNIKGLKLTNCGFTYLTEFRDITRKI